MLRLKAEERLDLVIGWNGSSEAFDISSTHDDDVIAVSRRERFADVFESLRARGLYGTGGAEFHDFIGRRGRQWTIEIEG
jgi:hypothetical protein